MDYRKKFLQFSTSNVEISSEVEEAIKKVISAKAEGLPLDFYKLETQFSYDDMSGAGVYFTAKLLLGADVKYQKSHLFLHGEKLDQEIMNNIILEVMLQCVYKTNL
jgi:hypothetical protein